MNRDRSEEERSDRSPPRRGLPLIAWLAILLFPIALWVFLSSPESGPNEIAYSRFRDELEAGNVLEVEMRGSRIRGRFETAVAILPPGESEPTAPTREFTTYIPSSGDEGLVDALRSRGVEIRAGPEEEGMPWLEVIVTLLPFALVLLVGWLIFRSLGRREGGLMSFGQSRARLYRKTAEALTFDDVAGHESAKEELRELIEFLRDPDRFHALGGEVPKGILLVGPPGTGKTLVARAVAGEAEVPFFSITGSDFMEMLVGVGAARVRDLFRDAKEAAPSIIFIDELDSIGRTRGAGIGGGHDEREQTLNQLLSELDGFEPSENVIVMAATNRPDILDPALTRAGRFNRHVVLDLPSLADREAILEVHARDKPLAGDVDLHRLAGGTPGLSGADLENILNEAALTAARKRKDAIYAEDVEEARDRVLLGLARKGLVLSDEERELLAYHEAGHAIVAATLPTSDPVHKVSIVPRGRAMGATQQFPERERYLYRRDELLERIAVLLAGRAAEELVFGARTTGAEDDLQQATRLARHMVLRWGMSDALGAMATGREETVFLGEELARRREFSEETAGRIDAEVAAILERAEEISTRTLVEHRPDLDLLARRLIEREELSGDDVNEILETGSEGADAREPRSALEHAQRT